MRLRIFLLLFASTLSFSASLQKSAGSIAQDIHNANINALLIFTSQDGLTSGNYHFTHVGVDMKTYTLPFLFPISSSYTNLDYLIVGNLGYSEVRLAKDIQDFPLLTAQNFLRTYTAGLGGGLRYHLSSEWSADVGMELIYSSVGLSMRENSSSLSDFIEDIFNKNYNTNLTYKFFSSLTYRKKIQDIYFYTTFSMEFFDTKSSFSITSLGKFSSQSFLATLNTGFETQPLYRYKRYYFTSELYAKYNNLQGQAASSVGFNNFYNLGAVGYWYNEKKNFWIQRYFLELSTAQVDGLEGYNVGIGFSVDF